MEENLKAKWRGQTRAIFNVQKLLGNAFFYSLNVGDNPPQPWRTCGSEKDRFLRSG